MDKYRKSRRNTSEREESLPEQETLDTPEAQPVRAWITIFALPIILVILGILGGVIVERIRGSDGVHTPEPPKGTIIIATGVGRRRVAAHPPPEPPKGIISATPSLLPPTNPATTPNVIETSIPLPRSVAAEISLAPTATDTLRPTPPTSLVTPSPIIVPPPEPSPPPTTRPTAPIAIPPSPSTVPLPSPSPVPPASTPTIPPPSATVTPVPSQAASPTPSATSSPAPITGTIIFVSRVSGNYDIYQMDAEYGTPTQLTTRDDEDIYPAWSPDSTRIAFASSKPLTELDIASGKIRNRRYLTILDIVSGTFHMPLMDTSDIDMDSRPDWSPDSASIVFTSAGHLYVAEADGSDWKQLMNAPPRVSYPSWSPNGNGIIFDTCNHGDGQIYRIHADGSNPESLFSDTTAQDCYPTWSPDGKFIAFTSTRDGQPDIYVMNYETGDVNRLTETPEMEIAPTWSPDGTHIVFARIHLGDTDCGVEFSCAIYIIDVTSHHEIARTDGMGIAYAAMPHWGATRQQK